MLSKNTKGLSKQEPLKEAFLYAKTGDVCKIQVFLENYHDNLNLCDEIGDTLITKVVSSTDIKTEAAKLALVRLLDNHGVDIHMPNNQTWQTPLHIAVRMKYEKIVDFLLGTDIAVTYTRDALMKEPIHYVVHTDLLKRYKAMEITQPLESSALKMIQGKIDYVLDSTTRESFLEDVKDITSRLNDSKAFNALVKTLTCIKDFPWFGFLNFKNIVGRSVLKMEDTIVLAEGNEIELKKIMERQIGDIYASVCSGLEIRFTFNQNQLPLFSYLDTREVDLQTSIRTLFNTKLSSSAYITHISEMNTNMIDPSDEHKICIEYLTSIRRNIAISYINEYDSNLKNNVRYKGELSNLIELAEGELFRFDDMIVHPDSILMRGHIMDFAREQFVGGHTYMVLPTYLKTRIDPFSLKFEDIDDYIKNLFGFDDTEIKSYQDGKVAVDFSEDDWKLWLHGVAVFMKRFFEDRQDCLLFFNDYTGINDAKDPYLNRMLASILQNNRDWRVTFWVVINMLYRKMEERKGGLRTHTDIRYKKAQSFTKSEFLTPLEKLNVFDIKGRLNGKAVIKNVEDVRTSLTWSFDPRLAPIFHYHHYRLSEHSDITFKEYLEKKYSATYCRTIHGLSSSIESTIEAILVKIKNVIGGFKYSVVFDNDLRDIISHESWSEDQKVNKIKALLAKNQDAINNIKTILTNSNLNNAYKISEIIKTFSIGGRLFETINADLSVNDKTQNITQMIDFADCMIVIMKNLTDGITDVDKYKLGIDETLHVLNISAILKSKEQIHQKANEILKSFKANVRVAITNIIKDETNTTKFEDIISIFRSHKGEMSSIFDTVSNTVADSSLSVDDKIKTITDDYVINANINDTKEIELRDLLNRSRFQKSVLQFEIENLYTSYIKEVYRILDKDVPDTKDEILKIKRIIQTDVLSFEDKVIKILEVSKESLPDLSVVDTSILDNLEKHFQAKLNKYFEDEIRNVPYTNLTKFLEIEEGDDKSPSFYKPDLLRRIEFYSNKKVYLSNPKIFEWVYRVALTTKNVQRIKTAAFSVDELWEDVLSDRESSDMNTCLLERFASGDLTEAVTYHFEEYKYDQVILLIIAMYVGRIRRDSYSSKSVTFQVFTEILMSKNTNPFRHIAFKNMIADEETKFLLDVFVYELFGPSEFIHKKPSQYKDVEKVEYLYDTYQSIKSYIHDDAITIIELVWLTYGVHPLATKILTECMRKWQRDVKNTKKRRDIAFHTIQKFYYVSFSALLGLEYMGDSIGFSNTMDNYDETNDEALYYSYPDKGGKDIIITNEERRELIEMFKLAEKKGKTAHLSPDDFEPFYPQSPLGIGLYDFVSINTHNQLLAYYDDKKEKVKWGDNHNYHDIIICPSLFFTDIMVSFEKFKDVYTELVNHYNSMCAMHSSSDPRQKYIQLSLMYYKMYENTITLHKLRNNFVEIIYRLDRFFTSIEIFNKSSENEYDQFENEYYETLKSILMKHINYFDKMLRNLFKVSNNPHIPMESLVKELNTNMTIKASMRFLMSHTWVYQAPIFVSAGDTFYPFVYGRISTSKKGYVTPLSIECVTGLDNVNPSVLLTGGSILSLLKYQAVQDAVTTKNPAKAQIADSIIVEYMRHVIHVGVLRCLYDGYEIGTKLKNFFIKDFAFYPKMQIEPVELGELYAKSYELDSSDKIMYKLPWDYFHQVEDWEYNIQHYVYENQYILSMIRRLDSGLSSLDGHDMTVLDHLVETANYPVISCILSRYAIPRDSLLDIAGKRIRLHRDILGINNKVELMTKLSEPLFEVLSISVATNESDYLIPKDLKSKYEEYVGNLIDEMDKVTGVTIMNLLESSHNDRENDTIPMHIIKTLYIPSSENCVLKKESTYYTSVYTLMTDFIRKNWIALFKRTLEARFVDDSSVLFGELEGIEDDLVEAVLRYPGNPRSHTNATLEDVTNVINSRLVLTFPQDQNSDITSVQDIREHITKHLMKIAQHMLLDLRSMTTNLVRLVINQALLSKTVYTIHNTVHLDLPTKSCSVSLT